MSYDTKDQAIRILTDLIARPSVNPMGRAHEGPAPVERDVNDYIQSLFAGAGTARDVAIERHQVGAAHENLVIRYPADEPGPAIVFESHCDVVPADDWLDRAFTPRMEGDVVYGRGACDDKGSLAAMVMAMLGLIRSGERPPRPVVLVCAGDEEFAQTGIKHFRELPCEVERGIFGEPTGLAPVVQHKGTLRWDITVHGKSAHTARPELGVNAIHGAMEVVAALRDHQDALQRDHPSPLMTGPLLTVSMIHGGRTRNAVPDECVLSVDFRLVPGMDMAGARDEVIAMLACTGWRITHGDLQLRTPPLSTSLDDPFSRQVLDICRAHAGADMALRGEPYGTDASWLADRAAVLVLGPGDIAAAHAVDEHIDVKDVVTCARMYRQIMSAP
jgi:acetylornithine deacetylase